MELKQAVEQVVEGILDKVVEKLTQAKAEGASRLGSSEPGTNTKDTGSKPAHVLWPWLAVLLALGIFRIIIEASLTSVSQPTHSLRTEFLTLPSDRRPPSPSERKRAAPPRLQPPPVFRSWFDVSGVTASVEPPRPTGTLVMEEGPTSWRAPTFSGDVSTFGNVYPAFGKKPDGRWKRSPRRRSAELVQKLLAAPGAILTRPFKRMAPPPLSNLHNSAAVLDDYIPPPQVPSHSLALARWTAFSPWYAAPRDTAPQPPIYEPLPMTSSDAAAGEGEFALMPYRDMGEFQAQIQAEAAAKLKAQRLRSEAINAELRSLGSLPARATSRDASTEEVVAAAVAKAVAKVVANDVSKAERGLEELKAQLATKDKLLRQSQGELSRAVEQLSRARSLLRAKERSLREVESALDDSTRGEARAVATLHHVKRQREGSELALAACSRGSAEKDKSLKHTKRELRVADKALRKVLHKKHQGGKDGKGGGHSKDLHQNGRRQHKGHGGGSQRKKGWQKP